MTYNMDKCSPHPYVTLYVQVFCDYDNLLAFPMAEVALTWDACVT